MIKISRDQFNTRWGALPQSLREALFSDENSTILWHVCGAQHLSEDKTAIVAAATGQAILGLIHPEDVAKNIKAELNLNQDIANAIYTEIDRKIFSPIRADLQKVYAPVPGAGSSPKAEVAVPSENVVNLKPAPAKAPAFETIPIVLVKEDTAKADKEKLAKLLAVGNTSGARPTSPASELAGGRARASMKDESFGAAQDEPFMLHKVTEVKPDETTPVDKRSRGGLFWFAGSGKLPEKETKAKIQIEEDKIGKPEYKTESKVVSTPQTPVRIVHYSEFKTPVSPFGTEEKLGVGGGKLETKPQPPKPPVPPAPRGISLVGVKPEQKPVTPLAPRVIKPEPVKKDVWPEPVILRKDDMGQNKTPLRDINITMNMGASMPQPTKEEVKPRPTIINEPLPQVVKRVDAVKDQNININISVTPPVQGIPMVGRAGGQNTETKKQEPTMSIPEVPQFKPKPVAPDVPPTPKKIDDDVVDLRTFEIRKGE